MGIEVIYKQRSGYFIGYGSRGAAVWKENVGRGCALMYSGGQGVGQKLWVVQVKVSQNGICEEADWSCRGSHADPMSKKYKRT